MVEERIRSIKRRSQSSLSLGLLRTTLSCILKEQARMEANQRMPNDNRKTTKRTTTRMRKKTMTMSMTTMMATAIKATSIQAVMVAKARRKERGKAILAFRQTTSSSPWSCSTTSPRPFASTKIGSTLLVSVMEAASSQTCWLVTPRRQPDSQLSPLPVAPTTRMVSRTSATRKRYRSLATTTVLRFL